MRISLARHAGFCYGVRRAVRMVEDAIASHDAVATLGPIIHHPAVVERFARQGVRVLHDPSEAHAGEAIVIRAHGAPPEEIRTLKEQDAAMIDATCSCLLAIHRIVEAAREPVIVVGEPNHPEVKAIVARCQRAHVVNGPEDIDALAPMEAAVVVSQSTLRQEVWQSAIRALKARIPRLDVHPTICEATQRRQAEAEDMAKRADAMLIIGGEESSNTRKLLEICQKHCPAYRVTDASEVPLALLKGLGHIGITAGASTPDEIIKEVVTVMSELDNKNVQTDSQQPDAAQNTADVSEAMDAVTQTQPEVAATEPEFAGESAELQESDGKDSNFMTEFEKTLVSIRPGQFVSGTVVQVTEDEVCVNIGYKSDGIVPRNELSSDEDPRQQFQVGDEIEVEVVKVNDGEGNVLLSQRNFIVMQNWGALVEKHENNEYVEGIGKSVVKGGLICDVQGVRTFVPASQLAERYVEKIEQFVGQTMMLKIIEVDRQKRRFVASRKAVLAEESKRLREELWEKLEVGAVVHGIVRRLTDFGAFVDIGGMDGLVHVTDLSWGRVRHPSDVVKPNDEIDVVVLAIDKDRNRISLGYKQLQARPWDNAAINYPVGSIVEGKVVRIVTFGAFVELEPGLDGLVHISQIANQRINKVEDALEIGQMVHVKVLDVNPEARRISLSIREALDVDAQPHDDLDALPEDFGEAITAYSTATSTPEIIEEEVPAEEPAVEAAPVAEAEEAPAAEAAEEAPEQE